MPLRRILPWHRWIGHNALRWKGFPGKVSGAWVLRGTRMPVSVIFQNLEAGASLDDIMEWFEVDREQVKAVIEFVARSLDKTPSPAVSR